MFNNVKERLRRTTLQSKVGAIAVLVALAVTGWSFILNTNPPPNTQAIVIAKYEAEKSAYDYAAQNAKAGQKAHDDLWGTSSRDAFRQDINQVTDADLKAKLIGFKALQDAYQAERNAVAKRYGLPACRVDDYDCNKWRVWKMCAPTYTDVAPQYLGCYEELAPISGRYPFEEYRRNITRKLWKYEELSREWGDLGLSVRNGRCQAYPEVCQAEAAEAREASDALKAARAFDEAYVSADDIGRMTLVAKGVIEKTWYWYLGLVFILELAFLGLVRVAPKPTTFEATVQGRKVGVVIPEMAFERPRLIGDVHVGWKVVVAWTGGCVLIDQDGARVPLTGNAHATREVLPMLVHPSLNAFLARKNAEDEKLTTYRRTLILAVEGLRKSRDFGRSETVRNVRQHLIQVLGEELPGDEIHLELGRRDEEEHMSETTVG